MKKIIISFLLLITLGCQSNSKINNKNNVIKIEEAKKIALKDAAINKDSSKFILEELIENDSPYYFFIITNEEKTYTYKIKKDTGKILDSQILNNTKEESKTNDSAKTFKNINHEQALDIALTDCGLKKDNIYNLKIKDKVKYNLKLIEVEFFHNNYEYEYYIRISDGFIIKEEVEYKAIITDNNPISITKARELALRLVKGPSNNDIKIIK